MHLKRFAAGLVACAVFALCWGVLAGDDASPKDNKKLSNAEKAKMILEKAEANRVSRVSTKLEKTEEGIEETKTWEKFNPDGTSLLKIQTTIMDPESKKVKWGCVNLVLSNDISWTIIGDIAIKSEVKRDVPASLRISDDAKYKLAEERYKGIPCHKITRINSSDDLNDNPIAVVEYVIGKKDFFIYSTAYYAKGGNLLVSLNYDSIKKMGKVKEDFFRVPEDCKMHIAKTPDEYAKLRALASDKLRIQSGSDKGIKDYYEKKYGTSDIDEIIARHLFTKKGR